MQSASILLLAGMLVAMLLGTIVWRRQHGPRSPSRSVDAFRGAMRAIEPDARKRRR